MTPTSTLIAPVRPNPARGRPGRHAVRFANYGAPGEPPVVDELAGDEAGLIEDLYARTAEACLLPPLAVREIIENLVHAEFAGACVSVFDGGASLRVSDCGPGIPDKDRALEIGFSTACERIRTVVRGVGSGLPIAAGAMEQAGGTFELSDNLRGGTVVTLTAPGARQSTRSQDLSDQARGIMALLVEVGAAAPSKLAAELGIPLGECGRELVLLEHRELIERAPDGSRRLTAGGTDVLTTLF